jgi:hypothetical protein
LRIRAHIGSRPVTSSAPMICPWSCGQCTSPEYHLAHEAARCGMPRMTTVDVVQANRGAQRIRRPSTAPGANPHPNHTTSAWHSQALASSPDWLNAAS